MCELKSLIIQQKANSPSQWFLYYFNEIVKNKFVWGDLVALEST